MINGFYITFLSMVSIYCYIKFSISLFIKLDCLTSGIGSFCSLNMLTCFSEPRPVFFPATNSLFFRSSSSSCSFCTRANSASLSAYSLANSVALLFLSFSMLIYYSSCSYSSSSCLTLICFWRSSSALISS